MLSASSVRVTLAGLSSSLTTFGFSPASVHRPAEDNPAVASFDPAQVVDNSLFDELEQSGFIASTLRNHGLPMGR